MDDAELIRGVVIDKKRVSEGMPKKVSKAKVALVATPLEITKTQVKAKIKISSTEQINAFSEQEREAIKKLADAIIDSGANVLLCQKGIQMQSSSTLQRAGFSPLRTSRRVI
jgi:predicted peroxiredoxin